MPGSALQWIANGEGGTPSVGNRTLRSAIQKSGGDPDANFPGLRLLYNVKAYGAIGDGIADDTAAVAAAIADAVAKNGVVYAPPGTYNVTNLQATGGTASTVLRFFGDGGGSVFKLKAASATTLFFITGIGGVAFDGLTLDGNKANCPAGLAMVRSDVSDTFVTNCKFLNGNQDSVFVTPDGLAGTATAQRVTVIGNHFVNCGNSGYGGVALAAEQVQGCVVADNVCDGMGGGLCDIEPFGAGAASDSVVIDGNTVRNTQSWGIPGAIQVTSDNASNPAGTGHDAVDHVIISNNVVHTTSTNGHGIYVQSSRRTLVTGNYVYGANQCGIFVDADAGRESKYVSILGNVIIDPSAGGGGFDAIRLNNAQFCTISENVCIDTRGTPLMARAIREQGTSTSNWFGPLFTSGATVENILLVGTPLVMETAGPMYVGGLVRVRAQGAARYRADFNRTSAAFNINAFDDTAGVYHPIVFGSHWADTRQTLDASTVTPSVSGGNAFDVAASANAVTNFTNGQDGQRITLRFTGARTITNGANIKLNTGANFVGAVDNTLSLQNFGGVWYERSRKV